VGEDSHDASFAGQYETFLNVAGVDSLTDAVLRCWALARSERVAVYQQQKKGMADNRLAVLVQVQVAADSSFVAFSADPISGERGRVIINANWGLGESVVSGLATPDAYVVDKASGALFSQTLGTKECMTVVQLDGVRTVAVPRFLRARPALNEAQVAWVVKLAAQLEEEMGWPVDIEGAFQSETLYLLQCRPISTIRG
jgi:pyruvate,water dikinase